MWMIRIPNWKKFNPRPDRANFTWFRLENTFFQDQSVFALNAEQKMLYLFILCEASKKNEERIKLRISYISALLRIDMSIVHRDFLLISHLGLLEINAAETDLLPSFSRHDDVTLPSNSPATNERTNGTNETGRTNDCGKRKTLPGIRMHYPQPFDELWVAYDRKGDKKKAFEVWSDLKLSHEEQLLLGKAVENYQKAQPEKQYRKDLERFLKTDWRETAHNVVQKVYGNGLQANGRYLTQAEKIRHNNDEAIKEFLGGSSFGNENGEGDLHG